MAGRDWFGAFVVIADGPGGPSQRFHEWKIEHVNIDEENCGFAEVSSGFGTRAEAVC